VIARLSLLIPEIIAILLLGVSIAALSGSEPIFARHFREGIVEVTGLELSPSIFFALAGVLLFSLRAALTLVLNEITAVFSANLESRMSMEIVRLLIEKDCKQEFEWNSEILNRILTVSTNMAFAQRTVLLSTIIGETSIILATLVLLMYVDLMLFIPVFLGLGLSITITIFLVSRLTLRVAREAESSALGLQYLSSSFALNFKQMWVWGDSQALTGLIGKQKTKFANANSRFFTLGASPKVIIELSLMIIVFAFACFIQFDVLNPTNQSLGIYAFGLLRILSSALPLQSTLALRKRVVSESQLSLGVLQKLRSSKSEDSIGLAVPSDVKSRAFLEISKPKIRVNPTKVIAFSDFTLDWGKAYCVAGPSGSGKTTLLEAISGLRNFDHEIQRNYRPRRVPGLIQYLSKESSLLATDIDKNLQFMSPKERGYLGNKKSMRLASVDFLDANSALTSEGIAVEKFSSGQIQRLLLARCINLDPEIIILDEPTSDLDDQTSIQVIEALVSWVRSNNKILVVASHNTKHFPLFDELIFVESK
jgi:ABC-type lipoprotein export system ATPase subunit